MDKNMDNIIIALRQSREYRENSNFKVAETYIDVLTFNYLTSMNAKKIANGLSLDEGLVEAVNIGKEIKDDDRSKILLKLGIEEPENLGNGINDYRRISAGEEGNFTDEAKAVHYAEIISLLAHQLREKFHMKIFGGTLVEDLVRASKQKGELIFGDKNEKLLQTYESKYKKLSMKKTSNREFTEDK